jgi:hypothetical protein
MATIADPILSRFRAALDEVYGERIELRPVRRRKTRQPVGYGRFARAANAIRFAIEELPPELLLATH